MPDYNTYDTIIQKLVADMAFSNKNKTILFTNFNVKDKSHLCLIEAALIDKHFFGINLKFDLNITDFRKLKKIFKIKSNIFKPDRTFIRSKKITSANAVIIDVAQKVQMVEAEHSKDILKNIYEAYYERGK